MTDPVVYDLTRLLLRSFKSGPNGIDRVDRNLARFFLRDTALDNRGILLSKLRPAVLSLGGAGALLDTVDRAWGADCDLAQDPAYQAVRAALLAPPKRRQHSRIVQPPLSWVATALRLASVVPPQFLVPRSVPRNAVFVHATQFPSMRLFRWLDRRPDVKPVFFIHDLLPLRYPEFFTAKNAEQHRQFLDVFLRYGRAAIVNTEVVKNDVIEFLRDRGVADRSILVAPMPAEPLFAQPMPPDVELHGHPYFVICGTIEPRKNHLLVLKVWQELVRTLGAEAPKLLIIGSRGWKNSNVFDLLDAAPCAASHIIEVSGLSSTAMRQLIANARALLMPSFAEGYGLPIIEALAVGAPVITSNIEVFREVGGGRISCCPPSDVPSWLEAVRAHATLRRGSSETVLVEWGNKTVWQTYFRNISLFIRSL